MPGRARSTDARVRHSAEGQAIFRREKCESCHPPPDYTTGKLTLAQGYEPPRNHPLWNDIDRVSVGTRVVVTR